MTKEEKINSIAADINPGEIPKPEEVKTVKPVEADPEGVKVEELPRLDNGMIDVEKISQGRKDEKGRYILPDDVIENYFNELPDGCTNESGNRWVFNGGLLKMADREIRQMGAYALHAKQKQRRTFKEAIDIMLRSQASAANISELGLEEGATNLDVVIAAALKQSARGNVKAMDFIRDTAGEKPAEQLNADITGLSEDDKAMLENIKKRLESD
jgi:hypothetical protein